MNFVTLFATLFYKAFKFLLLPSNQRLLQLFSCLWFEIEMSGSLAAGRGGNGSSSDVPVPDPQPFSIPHLFVWPHGGESAFLCGSFTG